MKRKGMVPPGNRKCWEIQRVGQQVCHLLRILAHSPWTLARFKTQCLHSYIFCIHFASSRDKGASIVNQCWCRERGKKRGKDEAHSRGIIQSNAADQSAKSVDNVDCQVWKRPRRCGIATSMHAMETAAVNDGSYPMRLGYRIRNATKGDKGKDSMASSH